MTTQNSIEEAEVQATTEMVAAAVSEKKSHRHLHSQVGHIADSDVEIHTVFGLPGAGKDLVCEYIEKLAEGLPVAWVSTSKLIKRHRDENTDLAQLFNEAEERRKMGELVPDYPMTEAVGREIIELYNKRKRIILLSGYNRTGAQSAELHNSGLTYVFYHFDIKEEVALRRIMHRARQAVARGEPVREDDIDETIIKHRLKVANETSAAGLAFVKEHHPDFLVTVHAERKLSSRMENVINNITDKKLLHLLNSRLENPLNPTVQEIRAIEAGSI